MIPKVEIEVESDFYLSSEETSKTYRLDIANDRMLNSLDGLEAVKQAIYLILNTERYRHEIYSWNYGVELDELIGKPTSYVLPEIKRRVTEALMQDDRISSVDAFVFESAKNKVYATFTVRTIYGAIDSRKEVVI